MAWICTKFESGKYKALFPATALILVGGISAAIAAPEEEHRGEQSLVATPNVPMVGMLQALPDHARAIEVGRAGLADNRAKPGSGCDKAIDTGDTIDSQIGGARMVGGIDTGICTNSDIDTYTDGTSSYVMIAGGTEAAWSHIDVTDPANPVMLYQHKWPGRAGKGTYTPDLKTFSIGTSHYIAMGLERTALTGACGVVIADVTVPTAPVIVEQYMNGSADIGDDWCDTHNVFVEKVANTGDGLYIYATADITADLRVLSINPVNYGGGSVSAPVEQGVYRSTQANAAVDGNTYDDVYVHDVTVQDGIVYASYWLDGLHVFDADEIRGGGQTAADVLTELTIGHVDITDPSFNSGEPFLVHHAYPSADGNHVFVEDEITFIAGDQPVQMFDTVSGALVDGLTIDDSTGDVPVIPAHNLEVSGDRLYVGWYQAGLQAWDFDGAGFLGSGLIPRTADSHHQAQVKSTDGFYDGAWGIRVRELAAVPEGGGAPALSTFAFQSDREFGLIVDCLGDGAGSLASCPAQYVAGGGDDGGDSGCNPRSPKCNP